MYDMYHVPRYDTNVRITVTYQGSEHFEQWTIDTVK